MAIHLGAKDEALHCDGRLEILQLRKQRGGISRRHLCPKGTFAPFVTMSAPSVPPPFPLVFPHTGARSWCKGGLTRRAGSKRMAWIPEGKKTGILICKKNKRIPCSPEETKRSLIPQSLLCCVADGGK